VWARALEEEDRLAGKLIERAVEALGAGIASAVNLLDIDAVIVGGGLGIRFGQTQLGRIEEAMMPHLFVDERPPAMHVAALGDLGGAIGAALLAAPAPSRRGARPARARRAGSRPAARRT
jgi:glucokinase